MSLYTSLLDDEVALYSSSTSSNSLGQTVNTWMYFQSGMSCRLSPISNEKRNLLPGTFVDAQYTVFFQPSASISHDYRIRYDGDDYKIIDLQHDSENLTQVGYLKRVDI